MSQQRNSATTSSATTVALNILTRRDHSEQELRQKLKLREFADDDIETAINNCLHYGYLNDERYAENLVRSHFNKGHGPYRIAQDMQHKGVAKELISEYLHQSEYDWFELAVTRLRSKFRQVATDLKEKQKQQRYLIGQGFNFEQVQYAQQCLAEQDDD